MGVREDLLGPAEDFEDEEEGAEKEWGSGEEDVEEERAVGSRVSCLGTRCRTLNSALTSF